VSAPLAILFRDEHYAAVFKPAGVQMHRSWIDREPTQYALQLARDALGRRVYPVHRLDRPTAGCLLFALSPDAAARMMEQFAAGRVEKTYLAVVRGHVAESGVIDYPLVEEADVLTDRRARRDQPAQPAVTSYRRLAAVELPHPVGRYATARYSLVRVTPHTGRRHQIRRHLKHIFHPIVGDTTHGDAAHNRLFREQFGCRRLLLAAIALATPHPYSGTHLHVTAPLDEELRGLLERLGLIDSTASFPRKREPSDFDDAGSPLARG
jgi:tRNA pseudouridine65 synthase